MRETQQLDIKALAREVAREIQKSNAILVKSSDIAAMLGYGYNSTPLRKLLEDPTFPPCVELTEGGHKRYRRKDVEQWIDSRFDDQAKMIFETVK